MEIKPRQYPHPVLAYFNNDYIDSNFNSELDISSTQTTYQFNIKYLTNNIELLQLIENKKALYACHIECPGTFFRTLKTSYEEESKFEIPAQQLDGKVEVCSFILATEDLYSYTNGSFHSDFEGVTFKISKGDVLALGSEENFDADKDIDSLKKIPSIFTISLDTNDETSPVTIDASSNKVVIKLSRENFERYKYLKESSNMQAILASLLIVPTLVSLLEMISEDEFYCEYEDLRWYRVLCSKLKDIGEDISGSKEFSDSTFNIAQKLIGNPLTNAFKDLEGYELEE